MMNDPLDLISTALVVGVLAELIDRLGRKPTNEEVTAALREAGFTDAECFRVDGPLDPPRFNPFVDRPVRNVREWDGN